MIVHEVEVGDKSTMIFELWPQLEVCTYDYTTLRCDDYLKIFNLNTERRTQNGTERNCSYRSIDYRLWLERSIWKIRNVTT